MSRLTTLIVLLLGGSLVGGCWMNLRHSVPEPIHITVDVNIRVQEELNDFFKTIDTQK